MPTVGINRLRLRGPPHQAARSTFLIEDACRTELPDSERLVLIRRLELGRDATAERAGAKGRPRSAAPMNWRRAIPAMAATMAAAARIASGSPAVPRHACCCSACCWPGGGRAAGTGRWPCRAGAASRSPNGWARHSRHMVRWGKLGGPGRADRPRRRGRRGRHRHRGAGRDGGRILTWRTRDLRRSNRTGRRYRSCSARPGRRRPLPT